MDNKKMEAQPPSSSSAAATTKTVNSSVDSKDQTKKKEATKTVPFFKLFAFSDTIDKSLMIIGTIGAIGNGLSLPLMAIIFGELTDSFGETENFHEVVLVVSTVIIKLKQSNFNTLVPFFRSLLFSSDLPLNLKLGLFKIRVFGCWCLCSSISP